MLFIGIYEANKMWNGKLECVSPDNKYILTITSNRSNAFDAPYCVRITDYGSFENMSYDFYIYECYEKPVVEWIDDYIIIKCYNRKNEVILYNIEVEQMVNEE